MTNLIKLTQASCFYTFLFRTEQEAKYLPLETLYSIIEFRLKNVMSDFKKCPAPRLLIGPPDHDVNFSPSWAVSMSYHRIWCLSN